MLASDLCIYRYRSDLGFFLFFLLVVVLVLQALNSKLKVF